MGTTLSPVGDASSTEALDGILSRVNDRWVERVAYFLAPALVPRSNFWERWGSVRFLIDQFAVHFGLESGLVDNMATLLQPAAVARLHQARDDIERTRTALIAMGRRRGTAGGVAALARQLLTQVEGWCAELERAVRPFTRADLSDQSRRTLGQLELAASLWR